MRLVDTSERAIAEGESRAHAQYGKPLSKREEQVLRLLCEYGFSYRELAFEVGTSEQTVKNHVYTVLAKTGAASPIRACRVLFEAETSQTLAAADRAVVEAEMAHRVCVNVPALIEALHAESSRMTVS